MNTSYINNPEAKLFKYTKKVLNFKQLHIGTFSRYMFTTLKKSPFARLLIFFIGGIYTAMISGHGNTGPKLFWAVILFSLLLLIFYIVCRKPGFNTDWIAGVIAGCIICSAGYIMMSIHYKAGEIIKLKGGYSGLAMLEIRESPTETAKSIKTIAVIKSRFNNGLSSSSRQKTLLYFEKDSLSKNLVPGDMVFARIQLTEVNSPGNPFEFDYPKYLSARSVYHQAYLAQGSWKKMENGGKQSFGKVAYHMQHKLLSQYDKIGLNKTYSSILSALTLGYKSDLESHTRHIFSQAGVMHVMALSGFNVGVIAVVLMFILSFLKNLRYGEALKVLIVVGVIWLFVFVTGLSASVTRAAVMITLVLCGKLLHRKINSINILAFSAFALLSFSPALITDISFQLSFAAVFGIIVFYPVLYKLIIFKFFLGDKLWQLFTLSCAAQIATLPFTLYYFHQFPVYFWLTNLYVVPLVSVIICVAGIYLLLSFVAPLSFLLGQLLALLLDVLYKGVSFTEILPYALIDHIGINQLQVLILVAIILSSAMCAIYRRKALITLPLFLIITFQCTSIYQAVERRKQQILMVGNRKDFTLVNLINGKKSLLLCNRRPSPDDPGLQYSFGNFWTKKGIKKNNSIIPLDEPFGYLASWLGNNKLFDFSGMRVLLLIDNALMNYDSKEPLKLEIVIVSSHFKSDLKSLLKLFSPEIIVLDSSLSHYQASRWKELCKKSGIQCWSVREKGAFCISR